MIKKCLLFLWIAISSLSLKAEDGYRLWLRYEKITDPALAAAYKSLLSSPVILGNTETAEFTQKELSTAMRGMLQVEPVFNDKISDKTTLLAGAGFQDEISKLIDQKDYDKIDDGFIILTKKINGRNRLIIAGKDEVGVMYGIFHLLRLMQMHQSLKDLHIVSNPKLKIRMLNHWDNLTRYVERGYAGLSIWNWQTLPGYADQRYFDYARANASIGINAVSLTNVNANSTVLTTEYIEKVEALADIFRIYGIKVYLTARFSAPIDIGGLKTADPLDPAVQKWWKDKADEIFGRVPGFGGFLVKANSEGQPGPQSYGRNHADGANMLADAVAPHGGNIIWRAFVYSNDDADKDRFKQAYNEFKPLDGQFRKNVLVQVKNGPIDFQPREPFHPLFGAMPNTPLMMEFQLTQEYLGQSTHLVYEAPLFKEVLNADTWVKGKGSYVSRVIDGSLDNHWLNGMAAVANIGSDMNWCGHIFGQANWYALGRLAWDMDLSSETIAEEWIRQTFDNKPTTIAPIKKIMLASREAMVNYMTPLGLHHIMADGHHYGPMPWGNTFKRADWNPVYFHRADSVGLGFDRTATGSKGLLLYAPPVAQQWSDMRTCDEKFILWYHHVPWNFKMASGNTLWQELCKKYYAGVDSVRWMLQEWKKVKGTVDRERFDSVNMMLRIQEKEAVWWRNACLLYFQTFSKQPIPSQYEKPDQTLAYYQSLKFPYAPGETAK